jgi:multidrug resistance efflux pump
MPMPSVQLKSEHAGKNDGSDVPRNVAHDRDDIKPRISLMPMLITLGTVAVAALLSWATWQTYMGAPWTRDGTVRAYVVTMAPEVAGRITKLPVADNQFVHKGDLLMVIDPTNYRIAVQLAEASVRQAEANAQNIDAQLLVQQAQIGQSQAQVEAAQAALTFGEQQAQRYKDLAKLRAGTVQEAQQTASTLAQNQAALRAAQSALTLALRQIETLKAQRSSAEAAIAQASAQHGQAQVNLERTRILSPVNGYVTNLLAQFGDYTSVGQRLIAVIDTDSFWIDGYFEETSLGRIQEGDPATVKLMGYSQLIRGHVAGVARGINVPNAQPDPAGLASVNPIFTWVRLAQRVPVRIHIDQVPDGVRLVAGMTGTVQVDPRCATSGTRRSSIRLLHPLLHRPYC